jgi:hypothetical protein
LINVFGSIGSFLSQIAQLWMLKRVWIEDSQGVRQALIAPVRQAFSKFTKPEGISSLRADRSVR